MSLDATTTDKKGTVSVVLGDTADSKSFTISAFGPIDQSSGEARPASLDGLGSSAGAEFAVNIFRWRGSPDPAGMRAYCQRKLKKDECDDDAFTGAERAEFLDLAAANETPWLATIKGSIGRTKFSFSPTRSPYAPQTEEQNDWAVGGSAGRYDPDLGYVAVGYAFQRAWAPSGSPRQICAPVDAGGLECRTFTVGPPRRSDQQIVNVQWRRFLSGGRVAFNPILGRDLEEGITFVRVPVYFFSNTNGGLAGGARFEWRSDTQEPTFVVFVGAALKVIG